MGTHSAMIVKAPFWMPEVPIPATARPTINIFEDVATPQSKEPNSKTPKKARKVHYTGWVNVIGQCFHNADVSANLGVEVHVQIARQR